MDNLEQKTETQVDDALNAIADETQDDQPDLADAVADAVDVVVPANSADDIAESADSVDHGNADEAYAAEIDSDEEPRGRIELSSEVQARMTECLTTELAAIDAQIARADQAAVEDPFFNRWRTILNVKRSRCIHALKQVGGSPLETTAEPSDVTVATPELVS